MVRALAGDSTMTRLRPPAGRGAPAARARGAFAAGGAPFDLAGTLFLRAATVFFAAGVFAAGVFAAGVFAAAGAGAFFTLFFAGVNGSVHLGGSGRIAIDPVLVVEPADEDRHGQLLGLRLGV